ncbi:hypothetical protein B0H14DRAFT_3081675 [Mycena olivaceomarginata]|nr:hypothetical protein B0H14DRAFT_3081675 [Mycena olivaceomarginata]
MSTRARTRTTSAAAAATVKPATSKASKAATAKSKRSDDIENDRPKPAPKTKSSKRAKSPTPAVYCLCRKGDDGSPMVNCGECDEWFHFACVNLSELNAEDIMLWEGPDAVEEVGKSTSKAASGSSTPTLKKEKILVDDPPPADPESAEDDPSSEDEYVADSGKANGPGAKRRRARRLSFSDESGGSDSGSDSEDTGGRTRKRASPGRGAHNLKRKAAFAEDAGALRRLRSARSSRQETTTGTASEDPARAFCLGKLEGVFRDIFLRYPHVRDGEGVLVEKKAGEELSEEEKARVEDAAKQFATELEQCVYDIYSEPDKRGMPSAGGKYKDRFRMLQFNLSKVDRTVLHKRIASADITPKEISLMSSTDLANEQAKQAIKIAEKEALEHSILEKTVIPRAKLTHKGLEDIEDIDDGGANLREREHGAAEGGGGEEGTGARGAGAGGAGWGGPPRVPMHVLTTPTEEMPMGSAFSGEMSTEPEMNLADLINIDDELQPVQQDVSAPPAPAPTVDLAPSSPIPGFGRALSPELPVAASSPTPEAARTASFDLNALWAAPKKEEDLPKDEASVSPPVTTSSPPPQQSHSPVSMEEPQNRKEEMMDLDETDDQDFDMFLEEKDNGPGPSSPEALQAAFNDLAQVWSGKINMPLDSTIPQETPVVARQIGGRTIEFGSPLWKTLFPLGPATDRRMNSTRELIAVAFSPGSSGANAGFQILTDFLIAKGRHGLVFPWGSRPKEFHPGKELYIIPLLSSDNLPDYMELLDNLALPKIRDTNYLVGIWVLNKGKLAPPPPPPMPMPTPAPPPAVMPQPQFNLPALPPAVPGVPAPQLTFEPSVLAAEVAALTPEQVRMMLQSLTASTLNAIPVPPAPMQPPTAMPQQQGWGHQPMPGPGPGMGYPPHYPQQQQHHGPPYGQQPPYDRRDYNRDPHQGYDQGGRDSGWNRGRGRGRGRGGPGGGGGGPQPAADSGWPRRRDNGPSPPQRRWN